MEWTRISLRKRVEKKLLKKQKTYETDQLMKEKRSEEFEVLEEVFDRSTLMVIYHFMNRGIIDEIHGVVKSGKESRVYWGKGAEGRELAIKIYLVVSSEFRRGILRYIEGDPRFQSVRHDTRSLIFAWAQKEFKNLELAKQAKIRSPRPIAVRKNVLIMDFIGKNGESAPLLKDYTPKNPTRVYKKLLTYIGELYRRAGLVHGDISEYNVMVWKEQPVLFDMSQAVPHVHPMSSSLLRRDLTNLNRFFSRLGVEVESTEEIYRRIRSYGKT